MMRIGDLAKLVVEKVRPERDHRMERVRAVAASHEWDGPLMLIGWVDVPSCSICGDDARTDRFCPGVRD